MQILAIETSCDETAAAIVTDRPDGSVTIRSHTVYSQIELHRRFGGVFPEAASREHILKMGPVIDETLRSAMDGPGSLTDWLKNHVDALAVTAGPGLIGSLLVGVATAKSLAYALNKPLLGINHHEGHLMAAWLEPALAAAGGVPRLPAVCLVVSGGHTKLVLMNGVGHFEELGRTRDDAVGEAFDKAARLLGLPYPGGPALSRLAAAYWEHGRQPAISLPRPLLDTPTYEFSFSGLKTAVAREVVRRGQLAGEDREMIAAAFEEAAVAVLVEKLRQAIEEFQPASVIVAGGVAANRWLRQELGRLVQNNPETRLHIPPVELCTDNAAMIGAAAIKRALNNQVSNWYDVHADDHYPLSQ